MLLRDGLAPLLAGDIGEHHPIAPRETELAFVLSGGLLQVFIALQFLDGGERTLAGLLQRIGDGLQAIGGEDFHITGRDLFEGIQLPVLHLQKQQATTGMKNDVIRIAPVAPHRGVVPDGVVILQQRFQPLPQAPLARGHTAHSAEVRDDVGHDG